MSKKMDSESHDVELKVKSCMNFCMKFLEIGGLWYTGKEKSISYTLYSKFILFYACIWTLSNYLHLYQSRNDFHELLDAMSFCISLTLFLIKVYIFNFKKKDIEHILNTISQNFFIHEETLSLENKEIIKSTLQQGRKMVIIYASIMLSGNAIYTIVSPLLASVSESTNTTEIIRVLPLKIWLPFDQMVSPNYEIAYGLTTASSLLVGWPYFSVDLFFFVVMIHLTGQFILLSDSLYSMTKNVYTRLSHDQRNQDQTYVNKVNKIKDRNDSRKLEDDGISMVHWKLIHLEAEKYLTECIKHHQALIDFTAKFNELWTAYFFAECITASVLICFLGYKAMTLDVDINLVKMLVYLATVILQLALQCVFGSNLITQSEAVYNAVYSSDWYNQSTQYKKFARMMIMHAQRPVKITAGQFGVLSLPLFARMIRSSYSYIALLRQMQEE